MTREAYPAAYLEHVLQTWMLRHLCTLAVTRKIYATDLSDREWACLCCRLPEMPKDVKMRVHALRDVLDAIFYVLKSGCPWRLLPGDFPLRQTVFYHFRRFRISGMWHRIFKVLCAAERVRQGRNPDASAAIVDAQSVKTVEESARIGGYGAHKNVKGRKRHLLVDTLGLPPSIYVTPADVQDRVGARWLLSGLKPLVSRLERIWADGAYSGEPLAGWCRKEGGWGLEVLTKQSLRT